MRLLYYVIKWFYFKLLSNVTNYINKINIKVNNMNICSLLYL